MFTANKPAFDTTNPADSIEGIATSAQDNTINAHVDQLWGAYIDGVGGRNALYIRGTAAPGEVAYLDDMRNVQTVHLDGSVQVLAPGSGGLHDVEHLSGAAGVAQTLEASGISLAGVRVTDIETLLIKGAGVLIDEHSFSSFSAITGYAGNVNGLELTSTDPAMAFDFSGVAMTGIDDLYVNDAFALRMDAADLADVAYLNVTGGPKLAVNDTVSLVGKTINGRFSAIEVAGDLTIDADTDGRYVETFIATGSNRTLAFVPAINVQIGDIQGFSTIDATQLVAAGVLTLDNDLNNGSALKILIEDSSLWMTGTSTDDLEVEAITSSTPHHVQYIFTLGGHDTITLGHGTQWIVSTGEGDDTIHAGAFLQADDAIDGGAGVDKLHVTGHTASTDLNGVRNVEVIHISNTGASSYAPVSTLVASGESILIDASDSTAQVDFDFTQLTGRIEYQAAQGGGTLTLSTDTEPDHYVLGAGADVLELSNTNMVVYLLYADSIENFNVSGADKIKTGTAGGNHYAVTVVLSSPVDFMSEVNTALSTVSGYTAAATDVITITVTGGLLDGTYLLQDWAGDGVTAGDFIVKLVGSTGTIQASDFI